MTNTEAVFFRSQLLERRSRLEAVRLESEQATRLLQEIDAALERMEVGTYGLCAVCNDPIEKERLAVDPLARVCLDHLTETEQRALEKDLELALRIQATLLPGHNVRSGDWQSYYHYRPCGPVSGDFCDLLDCDGNGLFFITGDISGKGVAASLLMSHLHAIFRTLVPLGLPLSELMARANTVFSRGTMPAHYATLACGFAQPSGVVEVCNAGHCPPVVLRHGEAVSLAATGLPLGMFAGGQYTAHRIALDPGDTLVLYTDGVTEARDGADAEYGFERLYAHLLACRALAPEALAKSCVSDVERFLSGAPQQDDVTIMVLRRG
ncbi:MAG TPA: SpoIIE family protein phosphatase [Bryobacteraceae bacterium]|nr:SpoIIE family protein phosphatase [Bryobacteraceae bacterium]